MIMNVWRELRTLRLITHYKWHGRRPWSLGYTNYKYRFLKDAIFDYGLIAEFAGNEPLPPRFGYRLDERAVEYLWVFSRLKPEHHKILDAGSALNFPYLFESPALEVRKIVICTLAPEPNHYKSDRVSYVYADLRDLIFRDDCFDAVVCISTLEHIGMDNTQLYTHDRSFKESRSTDYLRALSELKRVLKPGGKLLITVPFGKRANLGWLQQYDLEMVNGIVEHFGASSHHLDFFRYENDGWQWSSPECCKDDEYFDIHSASGFTPDYLAAARAVACIELVK